MGKIVKFGEDVENYSIPVLNEREIRAAAGILFLLMLISILMVIFKGDFTLLKYAVTIFLTDMVVRVFVNPKFAPTLIIGRLIVRDQTPEYVGAPQKKFAWIIGFVLAVTMYVLLVLVNSYSPITGLICLICLIFLFFESAFGICLGCKFYPLFYKGKVQYCPGEVCEVNDRHEIQKTSVAQLLIVLAFAGWIVLSVFLFKDFYAEKPTNLFGLEAPAKAE
ncbi:MAG: hypothetical protein FD181_2876 [Prolixibacteraceae bacterium]|nr:MAG: hypothetical protein FD181_2876 [Prolixibacteraceae bacterium]